MRWLLGTLFTSAVALLVYAQDKPPTVRVDVDMVLAYATVTDSLGHYVVGLDPTNFQISEDKIVQKIETFSSEDVPLSVGIILDVSSSMKSSLRLAKDAAVNFLK